MGTHRFIVGHVLDALKTLPDESVHCVVTSPPYYGLRDYGLPPVAWPEVEYSPVPGLPSVRVPAWEGQLGLEPTPEMYVGHLVLVFREVRRVLRRDGTLWLNLGDSYAGSWGNYGAREGKQRERIAERWHRPAYEDPRHGWDGLPPTAKPTGGLKEKDLIGIPWRVAFALQADGWFLRSDVIWEKPNCLPESVKDRPTQSHEYVFLMAKSPRYFYDAEAVKEPASPHFRKGGKAPYLAGGSATHGLGSRSLHQPAGEMGRNRRSVWEICTEPFPGAHFAVFPRALAELCIRAGTSERGCCPECGAPWEKVVRRQRTLNGEEAVSGGWPSSGEQRLGPQGVGHWRFSTKAETLGWRPTCTCGAPPGVGPEDLETIFSPVGRGNGEDPTLFIGRAGFNRPRKPQEGVRPVTRYEQRKYAEQLRNSPYRHLMEAEAGGAFEHYIRTDWNGARPIPSDLLERWIERGWLERVELPRWDPPDPVPCVVLDPFGGAGTVTLAAMSLGRDSVYIDLKREYAELALERCGFKGSGKLFDDHEWSLEEMPSSGSPRFSSPEGATATL